MRISKNIFISLDRLLIQNNDKDYPYALDQDIKCIITKFQNTHETRITIYYDEKNGEESTVENTNPTIAFWVENTPIKLSKRILLQTIFTQLKNLYPQILKNVNLSFLCSTVLSELRKSEENLFISRKGITAPALTAQSTQLKQVNTVFFPINPNHFKKPKDIITDRKEVEIIISLDFDDTIVSTEKSSRRNGIVLNQDLIDKLAELVVAAGGTSNIEFMILSARRQDNCHLSYIKINNVLPIFITALKEKISTINPTLQPNIIFHEHNIFCLMEKQIVKYTVGNATYCEFLEKSQVEMLKKSLKFTKIDITDLDLERQKNKASFIRHYFYPKRLEKKNDILFLHFDDNKDQLRELTDFFKYNANAFMIEVFPPDRMHLFQHAQALYLKSLEDTPISHAKNRNTLFATRVMDVEYNPDTSPVPSKPKAAKGLSSRAH